VHFDFDDAVALTVFAATAFDVEGEAAGFVASDLGFGLVGEEFSDGAENAGVGGWVGSGGAAYGGLVYDYDFVEIFYTIYFVVGAWHRLGSMEAAREFFG
jgi:hypothetical protein